jgi:type IV secretion system protein VirB10
MSTDDLGVVQGSRIRPLGKFLIYAGVVLSVGVLIYALFTQGMNWSVPPDADSGRSRIDLNALHDIPPEASPTPVQMHAVIPEMIQLVPTAAAPSAPTQPRQKSALEMWREMEAMKAREAPVMVTSFGDNKNVQEIASTRSQTGDLAHYHTAASPFTVMEGSHITASLISGINSDYAGPITAQVLQTVYDTATGKYLLIPPGAKLIGGFQQPDGPLEERIAIKWHRVVFPDTSSVDLPDAPSTDQQGYAGLTGDVNHHYGSIIGAAVLSSVLSIGPAVGSVLTFNSSTTSPYGGGVYASSPEQQLMMQGASSMGGRTSSTADRFLQPRINRPATVTIFPGAIVDVFCTHDLVLPGRYKDSAGQLVATAPLGAAIAPPALIQQPTSEPNQTFNTAQR